MRLNITNFHPQPSPSLTLIHDRGDVTVSVIFSTESENMFINARSPPPLFTVTTQLIIRSKGY